MAFMGRVISPDFTFPPTFLSVPISSIEKSRMIVKIPCSMPEEITLYESKWLGLYRNGKWDYVRRPNSRASVGILAITADEEIVLVEQFRIPVGKSVIEVPAGLYGDEPEFEGESLAECAGRELVEETGYVAENIRELLASPTSAGMTPEFTHLFLATGLTKIGKGGGVSGEEITTHIVPLKDLRSFLEERQRFGAAVDFKIHAALGAAGISF